MGWHECEYCKNAEIEMSKNNTSSGDVTMVFDSGRAWIMPDMIFHYVADHGYLPPKEFVDDIMKAKLLAGQRQQTKGLVSPTKVGYLSGEFGKGEIPTGFIGRLNNLMIEATKKGDRIQYRSA